MKNTLDILHVTFDKSPADETVISVARVVNGKIYVLKMELGEQADILYRLLTEKTAKVEIKAESKEQDTISRQETLKYFEGWKNQIKYYHPYAKNFDIPYEEAIQRIKDVPPVKSVSLEKPNKCDDAISRQQVKSDFADWFGYGYRYNWFYKHLSNIPPVNPQDTCSNCCNGNQIEKAKLCQKSYLAGMEHKQEQCDDAISRRMVLDATVNKNSIWNNITNAKGENLEEIISQLPPINQMNKWIGAEVLDDIKADIERMIPCSKEALSMKLGVLDIIDKHMMESEEDENDKDN